jgi:membrane-bound lytic murein transglycosylase C
VNEKKSFTTFKASQDEAFREYVEEVNKAYSAFRKEVGAVWDDPKLPSKKEWVSYEKDKKTRTAVDFDSKVIKVETIAANEEEAKKILKIALAKVVTEDVKDAYERDPLSQKIQQLNDKHGAAITAPEKREPLLAQSVFDVPPSMKQVKEYVNRHVQPKQIAAKPSKIKNAKVYSVTVQLPSDLMQKRSRQYLSDVKKNAARFDVPMPLIFAVMHTESSFNPMARSHIPAYGLMQIVPWSAGADTYKFLHKVKQQPSSTYLYNGQKNIEMGSAYLHILYYRYLRYITNPTSRLYCAIAAYNTGAGNVAWAWTRNYNIKLASQQINRLTPDQVYNHLLQNLKYDEPKHYLKRVNARMDQYHRLHGDI